MVMAKENIGNQTLSKINSERVLVFKRSRFFPITATSTLTITTKVIGNLDGLKKYFLPSQP